MKVYDTLTPALRAFIEKQKLFFVATSPRADTGHINLSPKGYDAFKIIDDLTVAYLDLGGSGIETQAHIQENGRITVMFCAFDGPPNIVRLFGTGEAIDFTHPEYQSYLDHFPGFDRARAVILIKLTRIQDSCGWGVPFYEFVGERDQLKRYIDHKSTDEWQQSRIEKNAASIDGLPGLTAKGETA